MLPKIECLYIQTCTSDNYLTLILKEIFYFLGLFKINNQKIYIKIRLQFFFVIQSFFFAMFYAFMQHT